MVCQRLQTCRRLPQYLKGSCDIISISSSTGKTGLRVVGRAMFSSTGSVISSTVLRTSLLRADVTSCSTDSIVCVVVVEYNAAE